MYIGILEFRGSIAHRAYGLRPAGEARGAAAAERVCVPVAASALGRHHRGNGWQRRKWTLRGTQDRDSEGGNAPGAAEIMGTVPGLALWMRAIPLAARTAIA
jgi:hypothetical protein